MNADQTAPTFKDRRTVLIVFGIVEILLGALAALLIPLMILGQVLAAHTPEPMPQQSLRQLIPAVFIYAVVAAVLIALGIGSCKTRRWAQALSLITGWSWLVIGLLTIVMMMVVLPDILKAANPQSQPVPDAARLMIMVFAILFMSIFFVVIPGVLVLIYSSRHVRATCEARDPTPHWTDACPLPVLGLGLWLAFGALIMLTLPLSTNSVLPLFGKLLSGVGGSLACVVLAAVFGYCAWAIYRLKAIGWWIALITVCIMSVSAWMTFTRIDLPEMYRVMGYSEQQIEMMKQFSFMQWSRMAYFSVSGAVLMLGFLLFVKRHFRTSGQAKSQANVER